MQTAADHIARLTAVERRLAALETAKPSVTLADSFVSLREGDTWVADALAGRPVVIKGYDIRPSETTPAVDPDLLAVREIAADSVLGIGSKALYLRGEYDDSSHFRGLLKAYKAGRNAR